MTEATSRDDSLVTARRLIETDAFPYAFLSQLAERESWRKELHRPVYHIHKWWANRLGSVFRGILLGCALPDSVELEHEFYRSHSISDLIVFDPFMGSGTTVGEAHKLGLTALGRDINPVAVEVVTTAFGPVDRQRLLDALESLENETGTRIRTLYKSRDLQSRPCDVLYFFWVMQSSCPSCQSAVDLFPSYIVARNAFPDRRPEVQILCPACGGIFQSISKRVGECRCGNTFDPTQGVAEGQFAKCGDCNESFKIIDAIASVDRRPDFRLFGKLVLTASGEKQYLPASPEDLQAFHLAEAELQAQVETGECRPPDLTLESGFNTRQAMRYGFRKWSDFFNARQMLALNWLQAGIERIEDPVASRWLMTLFSGTLEFNNLFASYKGEGTGAVRHMFSHHILKPERTPIEANVWGTSKSSGSFSGMFRTRLLRALDYRETPTELTKGRGPRRVCSPPFSGIVKSVWPHDSMTTDRGIYLTCGDSADSHIDDESVDFVVTDPPFFDNVHYSELADFFRAWHKTSSETCVGPVTTTRHVNEVQDTDSHQFARKLERVFRECNRVLKNDGYLVFTYHHSRSEGWSSLAQAILGAGFRVANAHPIKGDMSVATPKTQAKEPIQLDIIIVCKKESALLPVRPGVDDAIETAHVKLQKLASAGFRLSRNDRRITILGQLLTTIIEPDDICGLFDRVDTEIEAMPIVGAVPVKSRVQKVLF